MYYMNHQCSLPGHSSPRGIAACLLPLRQPTRPRREPSWLYAASIIAPTVKPFRAGSIRPDVALAGFPGGQAAHAEAGREDDGSHRGQGQDGQGPIDDG